MTLKAATSIFEQLIMKSEVFSNGTEIFHSVSHFSRGTIDSIVVMMEETGTPQSELLYLMAIVRRKASLVLLMAKQVL